MSLAQAACISVPSANIVAGDLSTTVPLFGQLDPKTPVGLTPHPGIQRVLSSREVFGIATRYGLSFPAGEAAPSLCVQRKGRPLSAEELRPVLLSALKIPDVQLDILEISARQVPPGHLDFRREGLNRAPKGDPQIPVIWQGRLIYDGQHSLAVWVKVRLAVTREIVVATEQIPAGSVIGSAQIQSVLKRQFPLPELSTGSQLTTKQITGMVARRTLALGERIVLTALEAPRDVGRGQTVHVHVIDGGATISLDGVAESSGNRGETIVVHNPSSGKNFRALIEGPNQVVVQLATGGSL